MDEGAIPANIRVHPVLELNEDELTYSYLNKKKGFEDWAAHIRE